MAEQIDLTAFDYKVRFISFDRDVPAVAIRLSGSTGVTKIYTYTGATATALINELNIANMSTTSLDKRILQRLISDGILAGTVSGSPD